MLCYQNGCKVEVRAEATTRCNAERRERHALLPSNLLGFTSNRIQDRLHVCVGLGGCTNMCSFRDP